MAKELSSWITVSAEGEGDEEEEAGKENSSWNCVADDVMEMILARLSVTDLVNASSACKQWRSFVSSPFLRSASRSIHTAKPWLFVLQEKRLLPGKNEALGFDPLARRWSRLRNWKGASPPPEEGQCALQEGNGLVFSMSSGRRLRYSAGIVKEKWQETPPMRCWRQLPLVTLVEGGQQKVFVMGGVYEFEEEPLSVEVLDVGKGEWEECEALPEEFRTSASSTWLSSAVLNGRSIYVWEKYSGDCCCFDVQSKRWRWRGVRKVRPPEAGVECVSLLACGDVLVLAGFAREGPDGGLLSFKLWRVDETTLDCREMGRMPSQMLNVFMKRGCEDGRSYSVEDDECQVLIKCRGMGDLVYVFTPTIDDHNGCLVCAVCDISGHNNGNSCRWEMLPKYAAASRTPLNPLHRIMYMSSPVTADRIFP